jgi:ABC-2 type transport system ATP-binding protein
MKAIEINSVTKYFGKKKAVDNITLTIEPNRIYGLLGRNGAGKTTLLNMITGRIFPTEGVIRIDGADIKDDGQGFRDVFYMTEKNLYPEDEKVKSIFRWTAEFYPAFDIGYAKELSDRFGLNINQKVKSLSTGYSSIFKVILTLASKADVMIFDEPILGLDANHRDMFYKELLANYNQRPKTIIISTHLIEEVAQVLEEVIIIKDGRLVTAQPVESLLSGAYTVSGESKKVDRYIAGRKHIAHETIGNIKTAIVLEDESKKDRALAQELGLEFAGVQLQKLFIGLTD